MDDPLKKLVVFIICLAVLGIIVALAWYLLVGPVPQPSLTVPANAL